MPKNNKGERNKRGSGTRMKREYVKPVIESEEFVANEYVAACWYIYCDKGHTMIYAGVNEPNFGENPDKDGFVIQYNLSTFGEKAWYRQDGEYRDVLSTGKYHVVKGIELKSNGNGPNAS